MVARLGTYKLSILLSSMEIVVVMAMDATVTIKISNTVFFEERKKTIKERILFLMFF